MQSIGTTLSWATSNIGNLFALIAAIIAAASMLIKSLEVLVKFLTTVIPSLKKADGTLVSAAAWLDALSKAKWLNAAAGSPSAAFHASLNPAGVDITDHAHAVILAPALKETKPGGYVRLGVLLGLMATSGALSCAIFQHPGPTIQGLLNCGEQVVANVATTAGPQVMRILTGGSPDWLSALSDLENSLGVGVECAVQDVISQLTGAKSGGYLGMMGANLTMSQRNVAIVNGTAYLDLQKAKRAGMVGQ